MCVPWQPALWACVKQCRTVGGMVARGRERATGASSQPPPRANCVPLCRCVRIDVCGGGMYGSLLRARSDLQVCGSEGRHVASLWRLRTRTCRSQPAGPNSRQQRFLAAAGVVVRHVQMHQPCANHPLHCVWLRVVTYQAATLHLSWWAAWMSLPLSLPDHTTAQSSLSPPR